MKTIRSALLLFSVLLIFAQADYSTELAKEIACDAKLKSAGDDCKSDMQCNSARNVFRNCKESDASATSLTTKYEAGEISAYVAY